MQIVIDIPDVMYEDIKSGKDGYSNYVHTAIRNGKTLPKSHRRLIELLLNMTEKMKKHT